MTPGLSVTYYKAQAEVYDCPAANVVYVKGRRAGGTTGAVHRLIELAHEHPQSKHLWVDTTQKNIERLVRRYFLPVLRGSRFVWQAGMQVLQFQSGAYCQFGSAQRPENLEGFGYQFFWLNEAGIILRNPELYHHTLVPMSLEAANPKWFFVGTPKGPGLFQEMFAWGTDETKPDWQSFRHPSGANPLLNVTLLERLKDRLPTSTYRQEVLAEFATGEEAVFQNITAAIEGDPEIAPPRPDIPYVLGIDLARLHDYTVIWVGRTDVRRAVWCDRFRGLPWQHQVDRILALAKRFNNAPAFVDATGVGGPVVEDLRRHGLAVEPVVLSAPRKKELIDQLALDLERTQFTLYPHEQTVRELNYFEQSVLPSGQLRFAAPPGEHDDCVIALALCLLGLGHGEQEFILGTRLATSEPDW